MKYVSVFVFIWTLIFGLQISVETRLIVLPFIIIFLGIILSISIYELDSFMKNGDDNNV